jgi:hypothetical protein
LDFSAEGAQSKRRHRLIKLCVLNVGNASFAIVDASWGKADVAQLLGGLIDAGSSRRSTPCAQRCAPGHRRD